MEEQIKAVQGDVTELVAETNRSRTRLHNLEGFAQAYLDVQRQHRRAEQRQYQRLATAINVGGLAMSVGMLILAAVTLYLHTG